MAPSNLAALAADTAPNEDLATPPAQYERLVAACRIVAAAGVLCLLLIVVRAFASGVGHAPQSTGVFGATITFLLGGGYDVLFVAGLAAAAMVTLWMRAGRWAIPPAWVARCFLAMAVFVLIASLANITVVRLVGRPLNFQWFYYSGFLRSAEARSAIMENLPWWAIIGLPTLCAAYIVLARRTARWMLGHPGHAPDGRRRTLLVAGALAAYGIGATGWIEWSDRDRNRFANPVWVFAASLVRPESTPVVFTMITPYGSEDFLSAADLAAADDPASSRLPPGRHAPRNVVFFVLENIGARYTDLYGGGYGVTPVLKREAARGASFRNIYAHAPATNKSIVALLCGVYPRVSFRFETDDTPEIPLPNLPAILRARGYATGFFSGAPLDYHGEGEFLAAGGKFDAIEDCRDRERDGMHFTSEWESVGGSSDLTTTESAIRWLEPRKDRPFMAVVWLIQPHYPYFVDGAERAVAEGDLLNRYLNAVEQSDRALARMMAWLDESGLTDSTLVVCVGDHGEAFGQHNNWGHGTHIYDENLHVPLLFINPRLFHGEVHDTVGGLVDVASTVTEILQIPPDPRWHGRSLFSTRRSGRVFFFGPWTDYLLGVRDGDRKVIYNATKDSFEVFDLARDPLEKVNLAPTSRDATEDAMLRMAGWAQTVERTFVDTLEKH
jgi:lipoteichoic acid synthase